MIGSPVFSAVIGGFSGAYTGNTTFTDPASASNTFSITFPSTSTVMLASSQSQIYLKPRAVLRNASNQDKVILSDMALSLASTVLLNWSNVATDADNAKDTGLARAAAGVVQLNNGSTAAGGLSSPARTPSAFTGTQNDYSPGVGLVQRWSGSSTPVVTGMAAGVDGETRFVWNVGATSIVLNNADAGSAAANQFTTSTGANLTVAQNKCVLCQYDATSQRWRATLLP